MSGADEPFYGLDLTLLPRKLHLLALDLRLLLFDGVDEYNAELTVLHAFDFAFCVGESKQRLDLCNMFRAQAHIALAVCPPSEGDGMQTIED